MTSGEDRCKESNVHSKNRMEGMPMRHENSWMGKAVTLAVVAVVGVAVMMAPGAVGEPVTGNGLSGSSVCAASHTAGPGTSQADFLHAVELGQQANLAQPAAICKLRPECWSNSDCDLRCGVGLGKCIHSNCPVRICVCR